MCLAKDVIRVMLRDGKAQEDVGAMQREKNVRSASSALSGSSCRLLPHPKYGSWAGWRSGFAHPTCLKDAAGQTRLGSPNPIQCVNEIRASGSLASTLNGVLPLGGHAAALLRPHFNFYFAIDRQPRHLLCLQLRPNSTAPSRTFTPREAGSGVFEA